MPKTYTISKDEIRTIDELRKKNKDKQVDKRLHAVKLREEGKQNNAIAEQLETSTDMISRWVSAYAKGGAEAPLPKPRPSRPTSISFDEESQMLAEFEAKAEIGQIVDVS